MLDILKPYERTKLRAKTFRDIVTFNEWMEKHGKTSKIVQLDTTTTATSTKMIKTTTTHYTIYYIDEESDTDE